MPTTKMILLRTLQLLVVCYVIICIAVYFFQERLIFFPEKLDAAHRFSFDRPFAEVTIPSGKDRLHGLYFRADSAKGLVFYLHGNAGSVDSWGAVGSTYNHLQWDVFILDYPGYGKSTGTISSKNQLLGSVQAAYDEMKKRYPEDRIVVLGYSVGTGPAAWLASVNHPKGLILQAPYYSMKDLMRHRFPVLPTFLLKYDFETNNYLERCPMPVTLFHGDRDEVIY
ncbi:MAG: alpha/beta fold hydrolase, partial [Chitinophagaceae bacterium]